MATYTSHYNLKKPAGTEDINVNDINGNADLTDSAIWATLTYHRTLEASDNMDLLASEGTGIFTIGNYLPQNAPSGYTWSMVIQIKRSDIFVHQYIIKAETGSVLVREYSGSPSVWGSWKYLSGYVARTRINYGSNSYVEYWKNGNIAQVYVKYAVSDGTISAWSSKQIATIPEGFRPLQETDVMGVVDRAGDEGAYAAVNSSGVVAIQTRYNAFSSSGGVIQANVVYPICN